MKVTHIFPGGRYRLQCGHVNTPPPALKGFQLPRVGQSWPCSRCTKHEPIFPRERDRPSELDKARGAATNRPDVTIPSRDGRYRQSRDADSVLVDRLFSDQEVG